MKVFDSTSFELILPASHRFPMLKYRLLSARVNCELPEISMLMAPASSREDIERVHASSYVSQVFDGTLSASEERRIGFPWSPSLVERSRRSVGATQAAAHSALLDGVSVNLAGGTHHAHHEFGSGFCVFNDIAIAIRVLQEKGIRRLAVLDLDVHQGDGTAALFEFDANVLTTSVHCGTNFPFRKIASDLDIALENGTGDEQYLDAVKYALARISVHGPDILFYLAGADPYVEDKLGHLSVSKSGLLLRDELVFTWARRTATPVAIVMGGGYATRIDDIVDIHFNTVRLALDHASAFNGMV
jgi:acetoin utilization deacetylase AcuC-like enzyme